MKIENKNNLFTEFFIRTLKGLEPDYTVIMTGELSPLHDLAKEYKRLHPGKDIPSDICISRITDPTGQMKRVSPKLWIEIEAVARLLPDTVLKILLDERLSIILNDGEGSYYDPLKTTISLKGAQDFIHEIGHHIWNTFLIKRNEKEKKKAVNNSYKRNDETRHQLPIELIPDNHKKYADLIGAWSGQFLIDPEKSRIGNRKNDLEEHFARNLDLLMRGMPLDVALSSKAEIDDLLEFYITSGISDEKHSSLYKYLLKNIYGKTGLNKIKPENAADGAVMTRDELFSYHLNRITFETNKKQDNTSQIALALDLTKDFVDFCLSKKAVNELQEALEQKGITAIDRLL